MGNKKNSGIRKLVLIIVFLLILILAAYSIKSDNNELLWKYLAFILVPILLIGLVVLLTLIIYFVCDRYFKSPRLNLYFIISLFAIVFLIHTICVLTVGLNSDNQNIVNLGYWEIIQKGFEEIYNQLGGLGFEGQEFNSTSVCASIFYFGSIAWLAITNALIITIGLNYRIYSYICVYLTKFKFRNKRNYYIFTSANETSFEFARNLKNTKSENINEIIFCSDELEPFDKENQLHKQIHELNFYYCPIRKVADVSKKISILGKLFRIEKSQEIIELLNKNEVYIFALGKDDSNKGDESLNSDIVFDDMELELKLIKNEGSNELSYQELKGICEPKSKEDNGILLNYYILSHNDINFEFYSEKLKDIFKDSYKDNKYRIDSDALMHNGLPFFNLKILNEAIMSGDDLIDQRLKNLKNDSCFNVSDNFLINCKKEEKEKFELKMIKTNIGYKEIDSKENDEYLKETIEDPKFDHLIIGFGETGQAALDSLILLENGGFLDNDLKLISTPFNALVIDKKISSEKDDEINGSFKNNHPLFAVADCELSFGDETIENDNKKEKKNEENKNNKKVTYSRTYESVINAYFPSRNENKKNHEFYLEKRNYYNFKEFNNVFNAPLIYYSSINYNSNIFYNKIIKKVLKESNKSIVIALGNDEENIKCANSILKFVHQSNEYINSYKKYNLRIYVNIKNSNNNNRINANELDVNERKIFVYCFGNYKDIYSYDIIDSKFDSQIYNLFNKNKHSTRSKNGNQYFYLTQNTIFNKKINETSSKLLKIYEEYLNQNNFKDSLIKMYEDYKEEKKELFNNKINVASSLINNSNSKQEDIKTALLKAIANEEVIEKIEPIFKDKTNCSIQELETRLFSTVFEDSVAKKGESKLEFVIDAIDNNKITDSIKKSFNNTKNILNKVNVTLVNKNIISVSEARDILFSKHSKIKYLEIIKALLNKYKDNENNINLINLKRIILKLFIKKCKFDNLHKALFNYLIDNGFIEYNNDKRLFTEYVCVYIENSKLFNLNEIKNFIDKCSISINHAKTDFNKDDLEKELLEDMVDQNKIDFLYKEISQIQINNEITKNDISNILKNYSSVFGLLHVKDVKKIEIIENSIIKNKYNKDVVNNINDIYKDFHPYYNFSNYLRFQYSINPEIFDKNNPGYIWNYLAQIENAKREKLRMIYGFTNVKNFNNNNSSHFYKDYIKCHNRIYPFDKRSNFKKDCDLKRNKKNKRPYLHYKFEDDLYISIIALLENMDKK